MSEDRQLGFAEAFLDPRLGSNGKLGKLDAVIDWSQLQPLAERLAVASTGRRPYPRLMMLKALYLQALYDLSDPGLEEALLDRMSFRRFCGLRLEDPTPDETTIWRFREEAGALLAEAFEEVNRQLDARGLMLRRGTLLDATLVQAQHRPPGRAPGSERIPAIPPGGRHPQEPDADWTRRDGKAFFGYKAHLGVDQGSGLIRRAVLTSAKVYESEVADALILGDEAAVYADRAYELKERRARLRAAGIRDRIMHRRHKHMAALPRWQQRRNLGIARRRAPVEATFSALKRLYGLGRARCRTLARNTTRLLAIITAYNLRRAVILGAA